MGSSAKPHMRKASRAQRLNSPSSLPLRTQSARQLSPKKQTYSAATGVHKAAEHITPQSNVSLNKPHTSFANKNRGGVTKNGLSLLVSICILLALTAIGIRNCSIAAEEKRQQEAVVAAAVAEAAKPIPAFTLEKANLNKFKSGTELSTFTLAKNDKSPKLKATHKESIEAALADITEVADVGFVFLNTKTGRGITYNADTEIYGASSYKAPYALYVCERLVELGRTSLSTTISSRTTGTVKGLIEDSIVWSSNAAFTTLRANFDSVQYEDWIKVMGVEDAPAGDGVWFPSYSARSSLKIWREMAGYFEFGSETSEWLKSLLTRPEVSFIRDGVAREGITVYNKAGLIASGEGFNSTSDAAVIEYKGKQYLMCILSSQRYSDASAARVSALAKVLFDARSTLEWE